MIYLSTIYLVIFLGIYEISVYILCTFLLLCNLSIYVFHLCTRYLSLIYLSTYLCIYHLPLILFIFIPICHLFIFVFIVYQSLLSLTLRTACLLSIYLFRELLPSVPNERYIFLSFDIVWFSLWISRVCWHRWIDFFLSISSYDVFSYDSSVHFSLNFSFIFVTSLSVSHNQSNSFLFYCTMDLCITEAFSVDLTIHISKHKIGLIYELFHIYLATIVFNHPSINAFIS